MKYAVWNRCTRAALMAAAIFGCLPAVRADLAPGLTLRGPQTAIPRRASIIFIQCEGLGYGDLSCYGQTNYQTPNIDKLAAEGIQFTNYYAGDAASSPARAALLTGLDSGHLPQRADVDVPLSANQTTVAQVLKNAGYRTGFLGEWLFGDGNSPGAPWRQGFDEFAGYFDPQDAANVYADFMWRYPHVIRDSSFQVVKVILDRDVFYYNEGGKQGTYLPDVQAQAAINFAKMSVPDKANRFRPFFLLVNFKIPGTGSAQVPSDAPYSDEPWPQTARNRAALVSRMDGYVGQLVDGLTKLGMTNNVAIFLSSDTGPQTGTNRIESTVFQSAGAFRGGRGDLFEGGLRVPLIVHWPGTIPAGLVSDYPCAAWDFLPTAAEIGYATAPTNIDGLSLLPALSGQASTNRHESFFWELHGRETTRAALVDGWKAIQTGTNAPEIYDLKADPTEARPVQNPEMAGEFEVLLKR